MASIPFTRIHRWIAVCLSISVVVLQSCAAQKNIRTAEDLQQAYKKAVMDAAIAEPSEIYRDLTAIVKYNDNLRWQTRTDSSRVLVVTWTAYAGYDAKEGQEDNLSRDIWVTAVPELQDFCKEIHLQQNNFSLRLRQLLGLPPDSPKNRFVEMWVDPADLFRPSPDPEITDRESELDFPGSEKFLKVSQAHKEWFIEMKSQSYTENPYPWTRLGYTYDWGNSNSEVGLSEFVIKAGATVQIHTVTSSADYCLNENN